MVGGCAGDGGAVVAAVDGHVWGGVAVPVDGVEEGCLVGVEDGVGAAFVVEVEGAEGFFGAEHGGWCGIWLDGCGVWLVGL